MDAEPEAGEETLTQGQAAGAEDQQAKKPHTSSLTVFRRHIVRTTLPDGSVVIDASRIHSVDTYEDWLESRGAQLPLDPAHVFQRTLTAHLTGADGRVSFDPNEEAAILAVLRRKSPWPCFQGTSFEKKGSKGFRSWGYHEKARIRDPRAAVEGDITESRGDLVKRASTSSLPNPPKAQQYLGGAQEINPVPETYHAVNYHTSSNYFMPVLGSPELPRKQFLDLGRVASGPGGPELQPLSAAHKHASRVDTRDAGGSNDNSSFMRMSSISGLDTSQLAKVHQGGSIQALGDTDITRLHSFSALFSNESDQPIGPPPPPPPPPLGNRALYSLPPSPAASKATLGQGLGDFLDQPAKSVSTSDLSPMNSFSDLSPLPSFSFLASALDMQQPNLSSGIPTYRALPRPPCFMAAPLHIELPPSPTIERALQCLAEFERRHPSHAVLVLNTLAGPSLNELYIAQSDSSLPWIGPVARSHNGSARALVGPGEMPGLVRVMLLLAQGVFGGEVDTMCRVLLVDGTEQLVRLTLWRCDMTLVCFGARLA